MNVRKVAKSNAKQALKGNWVRAITIFLIMVGIAIVLSMLEGGVQSLTGIGEYRDIYSTQYNYIDDIPNVSLISFAVNNLFSLMFSLITVPLGLGILGWYFNLSNGKAGNLQDIFHFFSSKVLLFRTFFMSFLIYIKTMGWSFLFMTPGLVCITVSILVMDETSDVMLLMGGLLMLSGILILIVGIIATMIITNRYFLAPYYLQDENNTANQAIKLSVQNTKGFIFDIMWIHLSFVGWFMLCIFILPILYVEPYYSTSMACYARYLMEYAERKKGSFDHLPL